VNNCDFKDLIVLKKAEADDDQRSLGSQNSAFKLAEPYKLSGVFSTSPYKKDLPAPLAKMKLFSKTKVFRQQTRKLNIQKSETSFVCSSLSKSVTDFTPQVNERKAFSKKIGQKWNDVHVDYETKIKKN